MWRCVALFRPICFTAILVSIIKIVGPLFALHFFSIAEIDLVRIPLFAALSVSAPELFWFPSFFSFLQLTSDAQQGMSSGYRGYDLNNMHLLKEDIAHRQLVADQL